MIFLIGGATHTGKTVCAQRLLETFHMPYLSIDHVKMGLIRSGVTDLKPTSSYDDLTAYLWPVMVEIIKTNIENRQHLVIEGCYIPHDYARYFKASELTVMRATFIVFSEAYCHHHMDTVVRMADAIEKRLSDELMKEPFMKENAFHLSGCERHNVPFVMVDTVYDVEAIVSFMADLIQGVLSLDEQK